MANRRRSGAKERFWRDVHTRHVASGLSARAFCRERALSEASFYSWRRTIAQRDAGIAPSQAAAPRARLTPNPNPTPKRQRATAFVPAVVTDDATPGVSITIELAGGRVMRLPEATAVARLVELVVALEAEAGG